MGGTNDEENLIDLFAREHFTAHKLLAEENPDNEKLVYALWCMSNMKGSSGKREELTSKEYEEAKIVFSNMQKKKFQNKENHPSYGTHISEERKRIIGNANKGNKYCVGRVVSEETRKKIGDANRNPSKETRRKMGESQHKRQIGSNNSNAKRVIRLSDYKIYACGKDGAIDNDIKYKTFIQRTQKGKGFMYYDEWLKQNNKIDNLEKIC